MNPPRCLVVIATLLSTLASPPASPAQAQPAARAVTVDWLGHAPPAAPDGVQWGVPWPNGAVRKADPLVLRAADGKGVPMQAWPLAYWPDGSVKWSGCAVSAAPTLAGPFTVDVGAGPAAARPIGVTEDASAVHVDTGAVRCDFPKWGAALVESMFVGQRKVAEQGKLVLQLEDRGGEWVGVVRTVGYTSKVTSVTVEQAGPLRAVVKVAGVHAADPAPQFGAAPNDKARELLPFVVRFYFYAGLGSVRIVHSFVFDGDQEKDFVKGMALSFTVPFQEELHNRHVRFAGDGTGVWRQPVRLLPGYRNALSPEQYEDHLAGRRVPNLDQLRNRAAAESVAVYNDAKLTQLGPDGFSIEKRTQPRSSWLRVTTGGRSLGLAALADVSGGIAVGVKDFWQKYPASLEVSGAASPKGELKVWLWSPDGPAMDMRTYDDVPHGLTTNYEDWKPGWGTANGVAHTADLTLWAFDAIPTDAALTGMANAAAAPPVIVATPEYYHAQKVFGVWSMPDRSTPTLKWVEDQLDQLYTFYHGQVDERSWYGFWDFGDVMHNYDFGRHEWRYDVGGWAWANTELMPDMFLWTTFLRTGKADAFRMAEAMTRHTSEVDVYHSGFFAPLGSRHNVNHWGDGAKQPRASHAMLKRYYYYLSGGDERIGDLMREQLDADLTYDRIRSIDPGHFAAGEYDPKKYPPGRIAQTQPGTGGGPGRGRGRGAANNAGGNTSGGVNGNASGTGGNAIGARGNANGAATGPAPAPAVATTPPAGGVSPPGTGGDAEVPATTPADVARVPATGPFADPRFTRANFGLDWISYSINWATEWERTGDPVYRDRVLAGMQNIVARSRGGPLGNNYFDIIFGGPEILFDEQQMFDFPEFWEGFVKVCEAVSTSGGNQMTAPRGAAYAAHARKSQKLGSLAWDKLVGTAVIAPGTVIPQNPRVTTPGVVRPVTDPVFLGRTNGWQLHGVASIQWALNAIEVTELAKPYLPEWEAARAGNGGRPTPAVADAATRPTQRPATLPAFEEPQ